MIRDVLRCKWYLDKSFMGIYFLFAELSFIIMLVISYYLSIKNMDYIGLCFDLFFTLLFISCKIIQYCIISLRVNNNVFTSIRESKRKKELNGCKKLVNLPIYYTDDIEEDIIEELKFLLCGLDTKYFSHFINKGGYFIIKKAKRKYFIPLALYNTVTKSITLNIGVRCLELDGSLTENKYTDLTTLKECLYHEFGHFIFDTELNMLPFTKRLYSLYKKEKKCFYKNTYKTKSKILQYFRRLKNMDSKISKLSYRYTNVSEFYAENYKDYKLGIEISDEVKEIIESI